MDNMDNIAWWYNLNFGGGVEDPVIINNLGALQRLCQNMRITKLNMKLVDVEDDENDIPNSPQFPFLTSEETLDLLFTESNIVIGYVEGDRITMGPYRSRLYDQLRSMLTTHSPYPQLQGMELQRQHNNYVDYEDELARRLDVLRETWTPVSDQNLRPFYTPYILRQRRFANKYDYHLCLFVNKENNEEDDQVAAEHGGNTLCRLAFTYKINSGDTTRYLYCNEMVNLANNQESQLFEAPREFAGPYMQFLGIASPTAKIAYPMREVGAELDADSMQQLTNFLGEQKQGGRRRRRRTRKRSNKRISNKSRRRY